MKKRYRARFRLLMILQVVLLGATLTVLSFSLLNTDHVAVPAVVGTVVLLQVVALLRSVESHVDTLEEFFAAVNYEDFTRRFVTDDLDAELKSAFNVILERFQDARAERDVQASYLETVVHHVPVPFIAVRADGSLSLVNNPARRLTGIPALRDIGQLSALDPRLPAMMREIEPGQQHLLQAKLREIPVELRVSVSEIRIGGETERLYSIENLSGELTARESSAWRNLIRVLTHEIMNTLTPVTSLAQTCESMLDDPQLKDDIRQAVGTIARRSEGLMNFVAKYRELLHVPRPKPEDLIVAEAFRSVLTLMSEELQDIETHIEVTPPSLAVHADPALLDQVLLNLVRNAADALEETEAPAVRLSARLDHGRVLMRVTDNGAGIPDNAVDQVFVPFFTTKRRGSGIGLSLSRQIMTAHGGEIAVDSGDRGTTVKLLF